MQESLLKANISTLYCFPRKCIFFPSDVYITYIFKLIQQLYISQVQWRSQPDSLETWKQSISKEMNNDDTLKFV